MEGEARQGGKGKEGIDWRRNKRKEREEERKGMEGEGEVEIAEMKGGKGNL